MPKLLLQILETSLPPEEAALLGASTLVKRFKKGDVLLKAGEACKHIYFLEQGCARKHDYKDGKAINLDFYLEGSFFTNLHSIRTGSISTYHITANEDSTIALFSSAALAALYEKYPAIKSFGNTIVETLLAEQEAHCDFLKLNTPMERYALLQATKSQLLNRISITQLASYLGTSRETLCRIRKKR